MRFWAEEPSRKLIRLLSKDGDVDAPVSVDKALYVRGFNTILQDGVETDDLEDEFARIERAIFPTIARIVKGEWEPDWHEAIKVLAALHLARSFWVRETYDRIVRRYFEEPMADMDEARLVAVFQKQFGRDPMRPELEALICERLDHWHRANIFFVEQSGATHNKALKMFSDKYIQIVRVELPGVELLTGDVPLVLANEGWLKVRVAIGDAALVYMPLGPRVGACLTTNKDEAFIGTIGRVDAQRLNNLMWRNSSRFLIAHPATDWKRSLGRS